MIDCSRQAGAEKLTGGEGAEDANREALPIASTCFILKRNDVITILVNSEMKKGKILAVMQVAPR
jgi:hypothetical protein